MKILILGCGYLGNRCATRWGAQGHAVTVLTRSEKKAESFREAGLRAIVGDVLDVDSLKQISEADLCLYAIGYDRSASADKRQVYVDGLKNVLSQISGKIPRLIYVSSTSVYGQDQGEFVDEDSVCEPIEENGRICLDAENLIRGSQKSSGEAKAAFESAVILRLAGLYGPYRMIARFDQLRQQTPLSGRPDAWLNLIHVDDAVQAIARIAGSDAGESSREAFVLKTYLLSDGHPLTREEFYSAIARDREFPEPVFLEAETSAELRRVSHGLNKRCQPEKTIAELQLNLKHPLATQAMKTS